MKTFLYSLLGFVVASAIAWGGLVVWGILFLPQGDSYWDRTPYAAEIFFAGWIAFAIGVAIWAGRLSRRGG